MTDLHGKKGLNSLKMLVFRSLSPGQLKLYPTVPKTEAMKKALELSVSKAFLAENSDDGCESSIVYARSLRPSLHVTFHCSVFAVTRRSQG